MQVTDIVVWRVFQDSAIVRTIEGGARAIRTAASNSRAVAYARGWSAAAAARPGQALVSAALTHIAITAAMVRPASWQWIILPATVAAIGLVLIVSSRPARSEQ